MDENEQQDPDAMREFAMLTSVYQTAVAIYNEACFQVMPPDEFQAIDKAAQSAAIRLATFVMDNLSRVRIVK